MQPHVATQAPVVGLAITAKSIVPGSETGASYESELIDATRFTVEVAKQFCWDKIRFYQQDEYETLYDLYGSLAQIQGNLRRVKPTFVGFRLLTKRDKTWFFPLCVISKINKLIFLVYFQ